MINKKVKLGDFNIEECRDGLLVRDRFTKEKIVNVKIEKYNGGTR
jgi:hypothetical protein